MTKKEFLKIKPGDTIFFKDTDEEEYLIVILYLIKVRRITKTQLGWTVQCDYLSILCDSEENRLEYAIERNDSISIQDRHMANVSSVSASMFKRWLLNDLFEKIL